MSVYVVTVCSMSVCHKRDTASTELTSTPVSKVMKIKSIRLGNHKAKPDAQDQNNNGYVLNFIEETMDDFMKILRFNHTCNAGAQVIYTLIMFKPLFRNSKMTDLL